MSLNSISFDDDEANSDLFVFSGHDLMLAHYDVCDLDWEEAAERSLIDERRGLVIAQVAALEDILDEFILYVEDPANPEAAQVELGQKMIGTRIDSFETGLRRAGLWDQVAEELVSFLRAVVNRRNKLAHGTIYRRIVGFPMPISEFVAAEQIDVEWMLADRRRATTEPVLIKGLREDLYEAAGAVTKLIEYGERLTKHAPPPSNYRGGQFTGSSEF